MNSNWRHNLGNLCSNKGIKPYLLAFHFLSLLTHFFLGRRPSRSGLPADSLSQSIEETITEGTEEREGEIEKSVTLSVREIEKSAVILSVREIKKSPATLSVREIEKSPVTLSVREIEQSPVTLSVREIEQSPVTLSVREIEKSPVTLPARDVEKSPVTLMSPEMKAIKSKSGIVALKFRM